MYTLHNLAYITQKHMNLRKFFILFIAFFAILGTAGRGDAQSPQKSASLAYTNNNYDFSLTYPSGWLVMEQPDAEAPLLDWVYFYRKDAKSNKGFDVIGVWVYEDDSFKEEETYDRRRSVVKKHNDLYYVLSYQGNSSPKITKKAFSTMKKSFHFSPAS